METEVANLGTVRSSDGTPIAFERFGDGPPVILVGGALNDRTAPWLVQLAALLGPTFTAYNYDRRGRGESGDTQPYAIEREVEDLEALIAEAAEPPASMDSLREPSWPSRRPPAGRPSPGLPCSSHLCPRDRAPTRTSTSRGSWTS